MHFEESVSVCRGYAIIQVSPCKSWLGTALKVLCIVPLPRATSDDCLVPLTALAASLLDSLFEQDISQVEIELQCMF